MITSVPLWEHIIVVLTLVATNTSMFVISKRRIKRLQMALVAKRVLLNEGPTPMLGCSYPLAPGDSLDLRALGLPITIETSRATTVTVR